ncbi:MAG: efflux RND transporter periplasmic adaptor subunit [Parcubacteria group bacterium]|nr:efflux RND transporter periplasmic adaptor subunit [Parcubacteria group bacterium]
MKLLRRWWFWMLVVLVVAVAAYFFVPKGPGIEYVTETVVTTDLVQTVDANGEVVSIDEVELSFDLSGTVNEVFVHVGDIVAVGDSLLLLDTTELSADVATAYQAVQVALSNLEKQRAGSTQEAIEVSSLGVDAAGATLLIADVNVESAIEQLVLTQLKYGADTDFAEAALQTASDNYNQAVQTSAQSVADAYDDLLSSAWAGVVEARAGLGQTDEVLGVRNGVFNDAYDSVLSAKNAGVLESAESAYVIAEKSVIAAESAVLSAGYGSSSGSIVEAGRATEDALEDVARLLLHTSSVVYATVTTTGFTASELSALADTVEASRRAVQVDQAALQNAFQATSTALVSRDSDLVDSANALSEKQASLASAKALEAYQIATAQQSVNSNQATSDLRKIEFAKAQANLSEVEAVPRVVDLASYEAEVARARAAYASAQARLSKATISSPIIGSVTQIAVESGEQVSGSEVVVTVQTTQEQFEITADVSESDIDKVSVGDVVALTFDAFGSGVVLEAYVGEINPAEKLIEGVVYYEITVYLADPLQAIALRPGMTTDLVIATDVRESTISVSQRSVKQDEEGSYLMLLVGNSPERRGVTTGLRGDLGRLEIMKGLEIGDEVIIKEITL